MGFGTVKAVIWGLLWVVDVERAKKYPPDNSELRRGTYYTLHFPRPFLDPGCRSCGPRGSGRRSCEPERKVGSKHGPVVPVLVLRRQDMVALGNLYPWEMRKVEEGWTHLGNGDAISPLKGLRGSVCQRLGARGARSLKGTLLDGGAPQVWKRCALPADGLRLDRGHDGLTWGLNGCVPGLGRGLKRGKPNAFFVFNLEAIKAIAPVGREGLGVPHS